MNIFLAVWTLEDLVSSVGSIDRGAAIKAPSTWVDYGVLREDSENTFILLEKAEGDGGHEHGPTREARVLGSFCFFSSLYSFRKGRSACLLLFFFISGKIVLIILPI